MSRRQLERALGFQMSLLHRHKLGIILLSIYTYSLFKKLLNVILLSLLSAFHVLKPHCPLLQKACGNDLLCSSESGSAPTNFA